MSKIKFSIIFLLLLSFKYSESVAQAPQKMSFQAVLRNSNSELIVNTMVGMRISIIQGTENGTEVYAEVQKPSTNANGLVSLAIGTGIVLRGDFSTINWGAGPYFIKTETDPRGGASYSITGISQFMSVPYALFAANSGSATGKDGQSAYQLWQGQPGNANKTEAEFLSTLKGLDGKSVFQIWKEQPGNSNKTEAEFLKSIAAVKGEPGLNGLSAFELWAGLAGNENKTSVDFFESLKGNPGAAGLNGQSAFDLWKAKPENAEKTMADYESSLIGKNGKTILNGLINPDATLGVLGDFYINTDSLTFFGPKADDGTWPAGISLKGNNGLGLDFKGSFTDLNAYLEAGHEALINKAYYHTTDKKSYIFTDQGWQIFAQDGTGSGNGNAEALNFNVNRNITRVGLPGVGTNLGAGKTTAQFLEDYFFPRLAATPPTAVLKANSLDIPYATWKNMQGFSTSLNFSYTITNKSKQDDTEDKNIASIKLMSGSTELAEGVVDNVVNPIEGTFANIVLANTAGSKTADFSKSFVLQVVDEQPSTVLSNTLTAYMRKAIRLTVSNPTMSPATLVYEYGTENIPITLNWNISNNDEVVKDIKVAGISTGSTTTTSKQVIFKSMNNGGTAAQNYEVIVNGDIYGDTKVVSPTIKWESNLYRGTIATAISPCESNFSITDAQIHTGNINQLGGTWKNETGNDFVCDAGGKYVFYAYPDDAKAPVVEYYDATFKAWQRYPDNQVKIINKANFVNASGYSGNNYKIVLVCVEYKSATVKIRIN